MAQPAQVRLEGVAQVAGRILIAWRNGESSVLNRELEHARFLAAQTHYASTLEMERMEVLSGVIEGLGYGYDERSGAVRLLEHLATAGAIWSTDPSKIN